MTATHEIDVATARDGILRALRRRSRTPARWSVRALDGRTGSALLITAAPRYLDADKQLHPADAAELGRLLALGGPARPEGVRIAATEAVLREFFNRADGRVSQ